jgi:deazaflavin-dependent oxidoreductase (nitroreductase family)
MDTTQDLKMPGTPKPWMNAVMRTMLRTPGVRALVGKAMALITVTGAKTARTYTTPVNYLRLDGTYVVLSQRHRTWWRNLRTVPAVELLVQGNAVRGTGAIAEGHEARETLARCLAAAPRVAKFYRVPTDTAGAVTPEGLDALLERVVVIVITPD